KVPEEIVTRHFVRTDGFYQIRKRVRALTVFGQHDLAQRAPFPRIDMVVCRNVLIYFTPQLQQRTLQLFAYSLRDSGYLVLGKAESPTQVAEYFIAVDKQQKVYQRQGERLLMPPAQIRQQASPGIHRLVPAQRLPGAVATIARAKDLPRAVGLQESI